MINIGDLIFNTPAQGVKLPQAGENQVQVANYFYTGNIGAAISDFTHTMFSLDNYNSFTLLGIEASVKILSSTNLLVQPEYAEVAIYGGSIDLPIPYPGGMEPSAGGYASAPVLQMGGNPYNKNLRFDLGAGYLIQPNTNLTCQVSLYKGSNFAANDQFICYTKMYWSI